MNKRIIIILALILIFSSCNQKDKLKQEQENEDPRKVEETETLKKTSIKNQGDSFVEINDKKYLRNESKEKKYDFKKEDYIKFNDLTDTFYNEELKMISNQSKYFQDGDIVNIEEVIENIDYDATKDISSFNFKNSSEDNSIKFKGDYTKKYKEDDKIRLKFKIVEIAKTEIDKFVDIDYNVYVDENNEFPELEKYLVK